MFKLVNTEEQMKMELEHASLERTKLNMAHNIQHTGTAKTKYSM